MNKSLYGGKPTSQIDCFFKIAEAMVVMAFAKHNLSMDNVPDVAAEIADQLNDYDKNLVVITDVGGPAEMGMSIFEKDPYIPPSEGGHVDQDAVIKWAVERIESFMIKP